MHRPARHLVIAAESTPARFRPANQMRLVPAEPANPQLASSMLPGMGGVQSGNGMSSLGLQSGAADKRLAHAIAVSRKSAAIRQRDAQQVALAGLAGPRSAHTGSTRGVEALQVSFSWAGDSIAATRAKIVEMYALRPVKAWGHLQTYVTTMFGSDMQALQDSLEQQPIVSIYDIQPYMPQAPEQNLNAAPEPVWEYVATRPRPDINGVANSRWIITKMVTPVGTKFAATLYQTAGSDDVQVIRTDNLANLEAATEYIRSYEVKVGDLSDAGHAHRTVFWNSFLRGNTASGMQHPLNRATGAQVDATNGAPSMLRHTALTRDVVPVDGLGEITKSPLIIAAVIAAGLFFFARK